jgi:hypothetical protein
VFNTRTKNLKRPYKDTKPRPQTKPLVYMLRRGE